MRFFFLIASGACGCVKQDGEGSNENERPEDKAKAKTGIYTKTQYWQSNFLFLLSFFSSEK